VNVRGLSDCRPKKTAEIIYFLKRSYTVPVIRSSLTLLKVKASKPFRKFDLSTEDLSSFKVHIDEVIEKSSLLIRVGNFGDNERQK